MRIPAEPDILIYALGGGMGHLTRSTAIARALAKKRVRPRILASIGFASLFASEDYQIDLLPELSASDDYRRFILDYLDKRPPDKLVIDALPMGLFGELVDYLPGFKGSKILIARILREDYLEQFDIRNFVRKYYNLTIVCEKMPVALFEHDNLIQAPAVLSATCEELLSPAAARKAINLNSEDFAVMIVGSDSRADTDVFFEAVHYAAIRSGLHGNKLRFASPYGDPDPTCRHTSYRPLMRLLRGIDLVVGNPGYNLFHECMATGTAALFAPKPRLYDDQEMRLTLNSFRGKVFRNSDDLVELLPIIAKTVCEKKENSLFFENGADMVAAAILG